MHPARVQGSGSREGAQACTGVHARARARGQACSRARLGVGVHSEPSPGRVGVCDACGLAYLWRVTTCTPWREPEGPGVCGEVPEGEGSHTRACAQTQMSTRVCVHRPGCEVCPPVPKVGGVRFLSERPCAWMCVLTCRAVERRRQGALGALRSHSVPTPRDADPTPQPLLTAWAGVWPGSSTGFAGSRWAPSMVAGALSAGLNPLRSWVGGGEQEEAERPREGDGLACCPRGLLTTLVSAVPGPSVPTTGKMSALVS